jgi:hypothetical protein
MLRTRDFSALKTSEPTITQGTRRDSVCLGDDTPAGRDQAPFTSSVAAVPSALSASTLAATRELASLSPAGLCVTCLVRVGRPRATVLRAVVCGPCWAAHGGFPDAGEMGPAPAVTVASADPRDQWHWFSALRRQAWVGQIRADGRANVLAVARLVALYAGWETLESRPTWVRLVARSGLSERTVARWLQELRVRGWLAHLERGSTPAHRPMVLTQQLAGNRAAVYGLRIPLTPEEALHRALEQLVARLVAELTEPAPADAPGDGPNTSHAWHTQRSDEAPRRPPAATPGALSGEDSAADGSAVAEVSAGSGPRAPAGSTQPTRSHQDHPRSAGDRNGSPSWSCFVERKSWVGGFSRASTPVDNRGTIAIDSDDQQEEKTALRADWDQRNGPDWALTIPTGRFAMLIAADWLRRRLPVFDSCSRKLIRHLCKPYWAAGWSNRDIVHAMDHRPGVFGQAPGVLISPARVAAPRVFIASRLRAWRDADGVILAGHYSARLADAVATKAARARVAACHGRAGAALLRPGEHTLTPDQITEHGHASKPPASPATRAAAKTTFAALTKPAHFFRRVDQAWVRPR